MPDQSRPRNPTLSRRTCLLALTSLAACAQTPDPATSTRQTPGRAAPEPSGSEPAALFSYPVVTGVLYSPFGASRGGGTRRHSGADISAPTGTPVRAAGAGRVIHAGYGYQNSASWGQAVLIDHGNGWITLYAHLSAVDVSVGTQLQGGEQIGRVGETGNATGPHLHIEVRRNGQALNPALHIPGIGTGA
jgi:murein DD-endopeptidase MepM/ murein hydrolase activator NlpD